MRLFSDRRRVLSDRQTAYTYLSQIEMTNPKFNKKEDVLWYLMTVGGFIIVGSSLFSHNTQPLVYLPA